jgi:uncharacterized protein YoxC
MSVDEIVKILADDSFARYQAERIVRTEVGRAANTGVQVAADSFPYEMTKEWISFQDVRTRGQKPKDKKDHYNLDGVVVDMNQPFVDPISGEKIMYPQAPKGSAAMVINCRCTWATIPKRDENDNLIKRGDYIPKESREEIEMKEALTEIREEIKGLTELLKPVDYSGVLNGISADTGNRVKEVSKTIEKVKEEINTEVKATIEQVREDLQSSLHNINRVNAKAKELTDIELKNEVVSLTDKFKEVENSLAQIDYQPNIEVKTDSAEAISEITKMKVEIVNGLNELKKLLSKKNNYTIEFNRDKDGLLISPIKIINE